MERRFKEQLLSKDINLRTIDVLEEEGIFNRITFETLNDKHFEELGKNLKIGQHALLLKVWEEFHGLSEG